MLFLVKIFNPTYNGAMKLELKVAQGLITKQKNLAIAESCSGGLLSHRLTNVPGSSLFLKFSIVAYSNESKVKLLKIPAALIQKHGSVSAEVAQLMAQNVRNILDSDFWIAITGIAGPSGGSKIKPVGTTFIALTSKKESSCVKYLFKGNRSNIKKQVSEQALKLLYHLIK